MDKLTIEMLELVEKDVSNKIYLEKQINNGHLLIAKARYIQGQMSVSSAQLPTEDSTEFKALSTVEREKEGEDNKWVLEKKHAVNKDEGYIDPTRWFGVLVPQSLQMARDKFRNCLFLIVENANIQNKLQTTIKQLVHLRAMKQHEFS